MNRSFPTIAPMEIVPGFSRIISCQVDPRNKNSLLKTKQVVTYSRNRDYRHGVVSIHFRIYKISVSKYLTGSFSQAKRCASYNMYFINDRSWSFPGFIILIFLRNGSGNFGEKVGLRIKIIHVERLRNIGRTICGYGPI